MRVGFILFVMADLLELFEEINQKHFDGFLDAPQLLWNSRLRTSAGRFIPGSRRCSRWMQKRPAVIEIASYLREEVRAMELIRDTLAHEMIHLWLWVRRKPYGHTEDFYTKMNLMGVSRYNPVPRLLPHKYLYRCAHCRMEFRVRRKLNALACAKCCKVHAGGGYDLRFLLVLESQLRN